MAALLERPKQHECNVGSTGCIVWHRSVLKHYGASIVIMRTRIDSEVGHTSSPSESDP